MKQALVIGVLFAACVGAQAGEEIKPEWNPPARYDHPFNGAVDVQYLPQPQVIIECAKLFKDHKIKDTAAYTQRGCSAVTNPNTCKMFIVDSPYRGATPEAIKRHEIGHCNGWPANHPD